MIASFDVLIYEYIEMSQERILYLYQQSFRACGLASCLPNDYIAVIDLENHDLPSSIEVNPKNRWRIEHTLDTKIPWSDECKNNRFHVDCYFCVLQNDLNRFFGSADYEFDQRAKDEPKYQTCYITEMVEKDKNITLHFSFYINENETISAGDIKLKFRVSLKPPIVSDLVFFLNIIQSILVSGQP